MLCVSACGRHFQDKDKVDTITRLCVITIDADNFPWIMSMVRLHKHQSATSFWVFFAAIPSITRCYVKLHNSST